MLKTIFEISSVAGLASSPVPCGTARRSSEILAARDPWATRPSVFRGRDSLCSRIPRPTRQTRRRSDRLDGTRRSRSLGACRGGQTPDVGTGHRSRSFQSGRVRRSSAGPPSCAAAWSAVNCIPRYDRSSSRWVFLRKSRFRGSSCSRSSRVGRAEHTKDGTGARGRRPPRSGSFGTPSFRRRGPDREPASQRACDRSGSLAACRRSAPQSGSRDSRSYGGRRATRTRPKSG